AKVIATMRNLPRPEADDLRGQTAMGGLDLQIVELDVLDDASVTAAVGTAERLVGGPLDVVVNNAGIGMAGPIEMSDMAAAELMFGTNLYGPHRVARAALPKMRGAGTGLIVNVSSQLGRMIVPSLALYSSTKFALEALSEQMAYELVPRGVDVAIVQPGGYPTEIWDNGDRYTAALLARTPDDIKAAYPELVDNIEMSGGGTTDPMDVPRAIARLIAMPPGQRPLRTPVHPGAKPQVPINEVSAKVQTERLGASPYGPWVKDVLGDTV
ncbi:MAG: SDR family NAD(P)-dependent oxidoreductase, partial [Pseudomonadota bacterium]